MNEVGNAHKKTRKKLDLSHLVCVFTVSYTHLPSCDNSEVILANIAGILR